MMDMSRREVGATLDAQPFGWYMAGILALGVALMFIDGYDLNGIAFAAPHIARAWHIAPSSFATAFAMGPVGMLLGGASFGALGDRFGRKPAILCAITVAGLAILATSLCTDVQSMIWARLVTGFGLGGLFPLMIAWVQEFVPKRWHATSVAIVGMGYSLGISSGGVVAAFLIPLSDWRIVFWLGGAAALCAVLLLALLLPESPKFLAVRGTRPAELARLMRRLAPGAGGQEGYFLAAESPAPVPGRRVLAQLFAGRLRWMTPLLWICYAASSVSVFFLTFWGPTLVEAMNVPPQPASIAASLFSIGGLVGGILIARLVDRFGSIVIFAMPLLAAPMIASLGSYGLSAGAYMVAMAVVGFFVVGGHTALHAISGIFYPSVCRGSGVGWAGSVARIGGIIGPYLGGALLAAHVPLPIIFAVAAIPSLIFCAGVCCLGVLHGRMRREAAASAAAHSAWPAPVGWDGQADLRTRGAG